MNKKYGLASAVLFGLMLSGCAGESATRVTSSPKPSPSASAVKAASVADYYAIVIKERSGVDEWIEDWDAHGCSSFSITAGPDPLCSAIAMRAYMVAGALESILRSAQTEEAPGFIGTPPDDISTVLKSTQVSAEEAYAAGKDWTAECPGDLCTNRTLVLSMAMEDLRGELDSWAAYVP